MSSKHSILLIDTPDDFATAISNNSHSIDQVNLFRSARNLPPRPFYEYDIIVFSPTVIIPTIALPRGGGYRRLIERDVSSAVKKGTVVVIFLNVTRWAKRKSNQGTRVEWSGLYQHFCPDLIISHKNDTQTTYCQNPEPIKRLGESLHEYACKMPIRSVVAPRAVHEGSFYPLATNVIGEWHSLIMHLGNGAVIALPEHEDNALVTKRLIQMIEEIKSLPLPEPTPVAAAVDQGGESPITITITHGLQPGQFRNDKSIRALKKASEERGKPIGINGETWDSFRDTLKDRLPDDHADELLGAITYSKNTITMDESSPLRINFVGFDKE